MLTNAGDGGVDGLTMGAAAYARHLMDRYGVPRTRQAVHKDARLPRRNGRIDVAGADAVLIKAGVIPSERITADVPDIDPEATPPSSNGTGRPLAASSVGGTYYDEKAQTERVIRELKRIELDEKLGKLLEVERVTDAMVLTGRRIGDVVDSLPMQADRIAAAAAAGGVAAVRAILREEARRLRETLAEQMRVLAASTEDEDEEGDGDGNQETP